MRKKVPRNQVLKSYARTASFFRVTESENEKQKVDVKNKP